MSNLLWVLIVLVVVTLAVYVSVGRLVASNLGNYRAEILSELNARLPFTLEAQQVSGEWHAFAPVIVLSQLRLSVLDSSLAPLELAEGRVAVDVFNSLRTMSLQLHRVALRGLSLRGEITAEGRFRLNGFDAGNSPVGDWLRELLLNVERVSLSDNLLALSLPGGEVRDFDLDLLLSREGSYRRLQAQLLSTRGTAITVQGEGLGDIFNPEEFNGELYLNVRSDDLRAMRDILAQRAPGLWASGRMALELWLTWDKGQPLVEARLDANDLLLRSDKSDLEVPLERLALRARLLQPQEEQWRIFASQVELTSDGQSLTLPRVQLDAWGSALRVRVEQMSLAPVNALLQTLQAAPAGLRQVMADLAPRGEVPLLQLSVGDVASPLRDWEVEARVRDFSLQSLNGAPGATAGRGYVQLSPGRGTAIVDSPNLALAFPDVFSRPLAFDEVYGSLDMAWDEQHFTIDSGLLTARGEEGRARALFDLDVPLVERESGVEMDLLVGLENTDVRWRDKYLPYTLDEGLLSWLSTSLGEGRVDQGAFVWRGSLRSGAAPLRTVQLAFNIADTQLMYHPDWPPVEVGRGVVLIDDGAVSGWAASGRLFQAQVHDLSVETQLNENDEFLLGVRGDIEGDAGDGLRVVNESPLAALVGGAFDSWQADGALLASVDLALNLGNSAQPPQVDVQTRWQDVQLQINPGGLQIRELNAELAYSTVAGFSGSQLQATLWGEPVSGGISQQHPEGRYEPGQSVLSIELASQAPMDNVREWLGLAPIALASGAARADVGVRIAPGEVPLLSISSDLVGVALDLPKPWRKRAAEVVPMQLQLPLGRQAGPLRLHLGDQLHLALQLQEGALAGGSLGLHRKAPPVQSGQFLVAGDAPLIDADDWIAFVSRYLLPPDGESAAHGNEVSDPMSAAAGLTALSVRMPSVHAEELHLFGTYFDEATLDLRFDPERWRIAAQTSWLQGEVSLARDGSGSSAQLQHLDLDRLPALTAGNGPPESSADQAPPDEGLSIAPITVVVDNLYRRGQRLGELGFDLRSADGVLHASNISGELAGLVIDPESAARLLWHQGSSGRTELRAGLSFSDLGQSFQDLGYERIVESDAGTLSLDLHWPGSPQQISLTHIGGALSLDMDAGSFREAPSGAAGAVRVVSILNLADIVRRLSLSQMFDSGIPFDQVHGEVYLHAGTIEVPLLEVVGSAGFQFSGVSDIEARSLSGQLVATLPVARNLPWIAALAANLPVAAGVYVVSKVFDKQMNRLSSAVYRIDGTWDLPEVRFDRVFDDELDRRPLQLEPITPEPEQTTPGATQ